MPHSTAVAEILPCCGSDAWAEALAARRPFVDKAALLACSDQIWLSLPREAWQQAFETHPRLGERHAGGASAQSLAWSAEEQRCAEPTEALHAANLRYEAKFGRIFLLCAEGRTGPEILANLQFRLTRDGETEWREAGEQQRQITRLRLQRWLEMTL